MTDKDNHHLNKWVDPERHMKYWRSWGSWFSWGSPVGLGIGYALIAISTGILIWLVRQ